MAKINRSFQTKSTAIEMKNYISSSLLPNPALSALLESAYWQGNVLNIFSKLGSGTIALTDYSVTIDIELTLFGSLAKKSIEGAIDKEFKQLKP